MSTENKQSTEKPAIDGHVGLLESADRGIIIVGRGKVRSIAASIAHAQSMGATVVVQDRPADVVVNGVGYYEIQKARPSGQISRLVTMLAAFASFDPSITGRSRDRELPQGTNIIEEYGKIQLKQSKLSKWERDRVVAIFESSFLRIE